MTSRGNKVSPQDKSRFTQGGTRHRIYQRKKTYPVDLRPESPDGRFEFTELDSVVSSPGLDLKMREGHDLPSQEDSKTILKLLKPMSPSPSETTVPGPGAYVKASCTSPDNSSVDNSCNFKEFEQMLQRLDPTSTRQENMILRSLMISQLDIIQQQSETIVSKDRQMRLLRLENENLKQRLERMERRRVRGEAEQFGLDSAPPRDSSAESNPRKRQLAESERSFSQSKRVKREPEVAQISSFKEFPRFDELPDEVLEESEYRSMIGEEVTAPRSPEPEPDKVKSRTSVNSELSGGGQGEAADKSGRSEKNKHKKQPKKAASVFAPPVENYEPLWTSHHYYIGCRNDISNKDDKLNEVEVLQRGVEVPKFREEKDYEGRMAKIMTNRRNPYAGKPLQENLEDSVFIKRHEKPEVNEKRQKKWDIQRMRERSYCEKLRARYSSPGRNKKEPDSLLPTPEDAEKILVSKDNKVPVTAFGEIVPDLPKTYFYPPWLENKQQKNESVQKKVRGSTL